MNKYDNKNSGALFKNEKKESEKHPDYRGQINVAGTEYWLSAWLKKSKAGNNYMSLAVQPKEAKEAGKEPQKDNGAPFSDEIPF